MKSNLQTCLTRLIRKVIKINNCPSLPIWVKNTIATLGNPKNVLRHCVGRGGGDRESFAATRQQHPLLIAAPPLDCSVPYCDTNASEESKKLLKID